MGYLDTNHGTSLVNCGYFPGVFCKACRGWLRAFSMLVDGMLWPGQVVLYF